MKSGIHLPAGMKGFPAYYLTTTLTASGDMLNMMTAMNMTSAATARWVPTSARGVCARTGRLTIVTKMTAKIKDNFGSSSEQNWDWNRYYARRAIPQLGRS